MRIRVLLLAAGLVIPANIVAAAPIPLTVGQGPGFDFSTLSAAINSEMSGNSYLITMAPGTYQNDFSVVFQPTDIEATPGTVTLLATTPNNQGIIETFAPLTVNGLTISGAATFPGGGDNAAAIRDHQSGGSLNVVNSVLENSQNGLLTEDPSRQEQVTVTNSQFFNDGAGNGQTHALYVGDALSLDVENSLFCGTNNGHDVKSRAATTTVAGSTMFIGATGSGCTMAGTTGAGVDAPNGGVLDLVGDSLIQGTNNSNGNLVLYGEEGLIAGVTNALTVTNTTFDGVPGSTGISEPASCPAPVQNTGSVFNGVTTPVSPPTCIAGAGPVPAAEPRTLGVLAIPLALLAFLRWRKSASVQA
jgi:hypothetical protein